MPLVNTPTLPSAEYSFENQPSIDIPRSSIRRPHSYKTTLDKAGVLYPVYLDEVLPGDTHVLDCSLITRMTTALCPIMDNLVLDMHFFFVPYRLCWKNWTMMHGEVENPGDLPISDELTTPYITCPDDGAEAGSIADYFGLPTGVKWRNGDVSALPFRAYNLIWNQWYRDENLQNSVDVLTSDGGDQLGFYKLLPRGKRKDYFTSCLPWTQKGFAINVPVGGTAPVVGNGKALGLTMSSSGTYNGVLGTVSNPSINPTSLQALAYNGSVLDAGGSHYVTQSLPSGHVAGVTSNPDASGLIADLTAASGTPVNLFRQAFQIQRLLERNARGGTRYTELLRAHFGVENPDSRLQRPELLGTFSVPISMHTVAQSSATSDDGTPQGNLSAFGLASSVNRAFAKSFTEYGVIIGLASVRADLTYQQGIDRMWSRRTRFDYYYPALAHLGEQAVLNKEIYTQGTDTDDDAFGYQERWSEYKYGVSKITGQLRSNFAQSLDMWHLSQHFNSLPALGDAFIRENPPLSRVLAVTDAPAFIFDAYFDCNSVRPMPLYSIPGMVDHF